MSVLSSKTLQKTSSTPATSRIGIVGIRVVVIPSYRSRTVLQKGGWTHCFTAACTGSFSYNLPFSTLTKPHSSSTAISSIKAMQARGLLRKHRRPGAPPGRSRALAINGFDACIYLVNLVTESRALSAQTRPSTRGTCGSWRATALTPTPGSTPSRSAALASARSFSARTP
ncbi:hypothetical protein B0H12DRAFT_206637 [Mycena haematopus]|nr:hypothetical protein B0H12DRAFT_206637 [Mycena haematopus]